MTLPKFEIMAAINLTTDSFSDGGLYYEKEAALKQIDELIRAGANYIDLGAESTRPGAEEVCVEAEWKKIDSVLTELEKRDLGHVKISIDTRKPEIMERLLTRKIHMINHVTDDFLPEALLKKIAEAGLSYTAMHMYRSPGVMQKTPLDEKEALEAVSNFFKHYSERLKSCGFSKDKIFFDPGIGFGKTDRANYSLMNEVKNYSKEYQVLIGISRKSFLGRTLDIESPVQRDKPSKVLEVALSFLGAKIMRTHDVRGLARLRYNEN